MAYDPVISVLDYLKETVKGEQETKAKLESWGNQLGEMMKAGLNVSEAVSDIRRVQIKLNPTEFQVFEENYPLFEEFPGRFGNAGSEDDPQPGNELHPKPSLAKKARLSV